MKFIIVIILMSISLTCHADMVNNIIASVGKYSITKYDLHRMDEFLQTSKSTNNSFIELLLAYSIFTIIENDPNIIYRNNELDNFIASLTNSTNATDQTTKMRLQLFHDFPEEYKIEVKKSQLIKTLIYYKTNLKNEADKPIPDEELQDFYTKNKRYFSEPPQLDIIIVSLVEPPDADLDKIGMIEHILTDITNILSKSDDINPLLEKYKKYIHFEPYSGRTGMKDVYQLYHDGCPEEFLNISLAPSIPTHTGPPIVIKNGLIVGYDKIILKNSPNKIHYFVLKIVNRKLEQQSSFEQSKAVIINILKENKLMTLIQNYLTDEIAKGEISVDIVDKSYEGVYDDFLRR